MASTKASKIRAQAKKKSLAALRDPGVIAREQQRLTRRELVLSAEARASVEEMRAAGFCPPNALPTVSQYSRYAAYLNSRAAANRAAAVESETATFIANGGVMDLVLARMRDPSIKDTAFAMLASVAQKGLGQAPALVDETQRVTLAGNQHTIEDDELDRVAAELLKLGLAGDE